MTSELILVVDDEPNIIQLNRLYLEREGFRVQAVGDGLTALEKIRILQPDLVVLDIMLPELDGLDVCRRIRAEKNTVPIIMVTARDDDIDKIIGLEMGADDYLTKPFNPRELIARVKAVLRRSDFRKEELLDVVRLGDLVVNPASREVKCRGSLVELRSQEFEVLLVLIHHPGIVMTREQLLSQAWGFDFLGQTRTVDVHIAQLRRKLVDSTIKIETITGIGYKLVA